MHRTSCRRVRRRRQSPTARRRAANGRPASRPSKRMKRGGGPKRSGRGLSSPRNWRRWPRCWPAWARVAMYLSRPPSADELYRTITLGASIADDELPLATSEREINEFLERYPDDPRAAKVARLPRTRSSWIRSSAGCSARPAADRPIDHCCRSSSCICRPLIAEATAPDAALSMLQSLVDLYAENAPATREQRDCK